MSKFPVDLSKFRKVKSDGNTSTFQHHEGHTITVAHNKLSSKLKEQLHSLPMAKPKKMAEGGDVLPDELSDIPQQDESKPSFAENVGSTIRQGVGDAAGAVGTVAGAVAQPIGNFAKGLFGVHEEQPIKYKPSVVADSDQISSDAGTQDSGKYPPLPKESPANETLLGPANSPAPVNQDPLALQGQIGSIQSQKAGEQQLANAQGNLGQAQAKIENQFQIDQQNSIKDQQAALQPYIEQNDALSKDIAAGHVDPNRHINNMSTGGKISTAIGLILGGMGSGLTHGPNLAFQYLQSQIDQDIDSQKADLNKKNNLLSHNIQMMGSLRAGIEMTRMQQYKLVQSKLNMEADKSQSPIAKANTAIINSQLDGKIADIARQGSLYNQAAQGGGDPARLVTVLVPKEHQKQAFSEIEAAENTRKMSGSILKSFEDAANANTVLKTGAGKLRTPAEVYALHQSMQPTFKDLEGTVRQAAMDNTFKNITPMPGDLPSTIETKRAALKDYLQSKLSAPTARGYGIDLSKFGRTQSAAGQGSAPGKSINFTPRGK